MQKNNEISFLNTKLPPYVFYYTLYHFVSTFALRIVYNVLSIPTIFNVHQE